MMMIIKNGYEIIIEDVETKDVVKYIYRKNEEQAKKEYIKYCMKYRVIINKFDDEKSTCYLDNAEYWQCVSGGKYYHE